MSGYLPRDRWDWHRLTSVQRFGLLLAVAGPVLTAVLALADLGTPWLAPLKPLAVTGPTMWVLAGTFFAQAAPSLASDPPRRYSPTAYRRMGIAFLVLGVAGTVLPIFF